MLDGVLDSRDRELKRTDSPRPHRTYIHANVRNDTLCLCLYRDLTFISALPFLVYFSYYNESDPPKAPFVIAYFSVCPTAHRIHSRFFAACSSGTLSDDLPPFLGTPSTSASWGPWACPGCPRDAYCLELSSLSAHLYVSYPSFPLSLNGTASGIFSLFPPP